MANGNYTRETLIRVVELTGSRVIAASSIAFLLLAVEKWWPQTLSSIEHIIISIVPAMLK
jgi:hypothetical protein